MLSVTTRLGCSIRFSFRGFPSEAAVAFEYQPEALQRQELVDFLDRFRLRRDEIGQSAGCDNAGLFTALTHDALDQTVDQSGIAEDQPRLNCADGGAPDDIARPRQFHAIELRRMLDQRVHRNPQAGSDRSADVLAAASDIIERRRSTEI